MAPTPPVSPLAPERFVDPPAIPGVRLTGAATGLKRSGKPDLMLLEAAEGAAAAGVTTRSRCPSAPVEWCRKALKSGRARAIVCNSGNANAFTGNAGDRTVSETVQAAAGLVGCAPEEVLVASTGVIGEPVPANGIAQRLPALHAELRPEGWRDAARAIMTTDTFPKAASATGRLDGRPFTISGIAKGSGMIAPDMATMLAFIATDAAVGPAALQAMTRRCADRTFNAITVDSDTSTSDTVLVLATGAHGGAPVTDARRLRPFQAALEAVMRELALLIVRDGEGAQKLITIDVTGAVSARSARRIGLSIANSPLVKTAFAGGDANWGRIVMAVGKAGEKADRDRLSIAMGGVEITRGGQLVPGYDETPVAAHVAGRDIRVAVDLGIGRGRARVWTCDLTHGYIDINADYRS